MVSPTDGKIKVNAAVSVTKLTHIALMSEAGSGPLMQQRNQTCRNSSLVTLSTDRTRILRNGRRGEHVGRRTMSECLVNGTLHTSRLHMVLDERACASGGELSLQKLQTVQNRRKVHR
jgi:hypothetical protein